MVCMLLLQISMFLFRISLSVLLLLRVSSSDLGCFKVNSCKCIMKDGSGVIDLKAMGDHQGFLGRLRPLEAEQPSEEEELYLSFSPCLRFSEPDDLQGTECMDVAACVLVRFQSTFSSRYINYGRHQGNQFSYNHTLGTLSVSYFADGEQPLTVVHYHCDPHQSVSIIKEQRLSPQQPLHIWVESPCACPNACAMGDLGVGTIFLILLCLSAAAYFILGSCALRASRSRGGGGGGGLQISPEDSVWCSICYLCSTDQSQHRAEGETHT